VRELRTPSPLFFTFVACQLLSGNNEVIGENGSNDLFRRRTLKPYIDEFVSIQIHLMIVLDVNTVLLAFNLIT
jgi:hypothetical protein